MSNLKFLLVEGMLACLNPAFTVKQQEKKKEKAKG